MLSKLEIATTHPTQSQPEMQYDVAGYRPDVGAFCAGEPAHMTYLEPVEKAVPVLNLIIGAGFTGKVSGSEAAEYGAAIVSLVNSLEIEGISTAITMRFRATDPQNHVPIGPHQLDVPVKTAGQPLDLDLLLFTIAHPAMHRRIKFAWIGWAGGKVKGEHDWHCGRSGFQPEASDFASDTFALPSIDMIRTGGPIDYKSSVSALFEAWQEKYHGVTA